MGHRLIQFTLSVLLWTIFAGCYGSVQLNDDVEFDHYNKPISLNHPTLQWNQKTKDPIQDLITVNDSLALVWTHRGSVMILNLNNGKKQGSVWTPSMGHITGMTVSNDGQRFAYVSMKNRMVGAYDIRRGKQIWNNHVDNLIENEPLLLSDTLVAIGTRSGIKLFNLYNGEIINEKKNRFGVIKLFSANPGKFLAVTDDGHLQCYDHQLSKMWNQALDLNFNLNVKVDQDRIFVGPGRDSLWVLDAETGNIQHGIHFMNGFEFQTQDNDLFLIYRNGHLMRMTLNGEISWTSDFNLGLPSESFFQTDGNLIIPFAKGVAINVDADTGTEIWRSDTLRRLAGFWQSGSGFLMQDVKFQIQYYK